MTSLLGNIHAETNICQFTLPGQDRGHSNPSTTYAMPRDLAESCCLPKNCVSWQYWERDSLKAPDGLSLMCCCCCWLDPVNTAHVLKEKNHPINKMEVDTEHMRMSLLQGACKFCLFNRTNNISYHQLRVNSASFPFLNALCTLSQSILTTTQGGSIIIHSIVQSRKLRFREGKCLGQGCSSAIPSPETFSLAMPGF